MNKVPVGPAYKPEFELPKYSFVFECNYNEIIAII